MNEETSVKPNEKVNMHLNFISSSWQAAGDGKTIPKLDPWSASKLDPWSAQKPDPWSTTEAPQVLAEITSSAPMDYVLALQKNKTSIQNFSLWNPKKLEQLMLEIAAAVEKNTDNIAQDESRYQGLPFAMTKTSVEAVAALARKLASELHKNHGTPRGLVGIISAWPLSFHLIGERLLRALATKNPVVIKPSELSSVSGNWWGKILVETSLPPGCVQIFQGGPEFAEFLVQHPSIKSLCFIGKTETAKKFIPKIDIFQKRISLSLSTRNSMVFLPGVTKDQVAMAVKSYFNGQGQTCWNAGRVFVLDSEEKEITGWITEQFNNLENRGPADFENQQSPWLPLINSEMVTKVQQVKNQAIQEEGKLIAGGNIVSGTFLSPLLMIHLPNCSDLQTLDVPLMNITSVKYPFDVVKWINTSDLAHCVWIWGDAEKAQKLAAQLQVGEVMINQATQFEATTVVGDKNSYLGDDFRDLQSRLWVFAPELGQKNDINS